MRTKCLNFQLQRIRYNYRRLLCEIDGENIYQIPQKKGNFENTEHPDRSLGDRYWER